MSHFEIACAVAVSNLGNCIARQKSICNCSDACRAPPMLLCDVRTRTSTRLKETREASPACSHPSPARQKSDETWDDSALADDVATISYEQALRSHRRVPPAEARTAIADDPDAAACSSCHASHLPDHSGAKNARPPASPFASPKRKRPNCTSAPQPPNSASRPTFAPASLKRNRLRAQVKEALSQMQAHSRTASGSTLAHPTSAPQASTRRQSGRSRFLDSLTR